MPDAEGSRSYKLSPGFERNYTKIPNQVLRSETISGNAKALYAIIIDAAHRRIEPNQTQLGQLLGGAKKTAVSALVELRDAGLLRVEKRGQGMPSVYTLIHPDDLLKVPEGPSRSSAAAHPSTSLKTSVKDKVKDLREAQVSSRPPDVLWDALVEVFGASPTGRTERASWNAALRSLRESGATPDSLRAAALAWPDKYERATMTPFALAKHWTILTARPKTAVDYRNDRLAETIARLDNWRPEAGV